MTAGTVATDLTVIKVGRLPGAGCVTVIAGVAAGDVVAVFSFRRTAVVAGETTANNVTVIDANDRFPACVAVAILADVAGVDVPGILAGGRRAIMTAGTTGAYLAVVKIGRLPGIGCMTAFTVITTGDVVAVFAFRDAAVVAGGTAANDVGVIDADDRFPEAVTMAVLTDIAGSYVRTCLAGCG